MPPKSGRGSNKSSRGSRAPASKSGPLAESSTLPGVDSDTSKKRGRAASNVTEETQSKRAKKGILNTILYFMMFNTILGAPKSSSGLARCVLSVIFI
jgi:hypothetical protein